LLRRRGNPLRGGKLAFFVGEFLEAPLKALAGPFAPFGQHLTLDLDQWRAPGDFLVFHFHQPKNKTAPLPVLVSLHGFSLPPFGS
jgi:hypothetical protein